MSPGLVHVANSAGVLFHDGAGFDGARPGLALYGVSPSERGDGGRARARDDSETRVMAVQDDPAGTPLGYGGRFVTARPSGSRRFPSAIMTVSGASFSGRVRVLMRGSERRWSAP